MSGKAENPLKAFVSNGSILFGVFAGCWLATFGTSNQTVLRAMAAYSAPETQWAVFLCLAVYLATFTWLRFLRNPDIALSTEHPNLWGIFAALEIGISYVLNYTMASTSFQALLLLSGVTLSMGIGVLRECRSGESQRKDSSMVIISFVVFFMLASIWRPESINFLQYHGQPRWTGPWNNPNIFGLLMGTGIALVIGSVILVLVEGNTKQRILKCARVFLGIIAVIILGRGLFHSFSRGAWLATVCGMAYLAGSSFRLLVFQERDKLLIAKEAILHALHFFWLKRNWQPVFVILISVMVLGFWQFRETDWYPAHRAFSAVDIADFSWRNRIAAWEGDWQMMAEKPWFGFGWNQPEPMYEHYYLSAKLNESVAIEMNDYLMLGATLGIPALFCFGMYLWMASGQKIEVRNEKLGEGSQNPELAEAEWFRITCRAGAVVLLVGFWFDGGLFRLTTGSTFWILLELGNVQNKTRMHTNGH